MAGQHFQRVAPNWALPLVFQVAQPGSRSDERRTFARHCIGEPHAVTGRAETDVLGCGSHARTWRSVSGYGAVISVEVIGHDPRLLSVCAQASRIATFSHQ